MNTPSYRLIFDGKIKQGEELQQVKARMISLFRADAKAIDRLFKTSATEIKSGLTRQQALKYKQALEKTGALCRIVKEKPRSEPPASPPKSPLPAHATLCHSKIPYHQKGLFADIIWPVVQVKNIFETIYDRILEMIWHELMGRRQSHSQVSELIAFLVFSVLALVFYYTRDYEDVIVLGLLSIWCCDYWVAKRTYLREEKYEEVTLRYQKNGKIHWKQVCHDGEIHALSIDRTTIGQVSIVRTALVGGAFQEFMGYVWRIYLTLDDGTDFLIAQQKAVNRAASTATKLAGYFNVPVIFIDSDGKSPFACDDSGPLLLKHTIFSSGSITSEESAQSVRLTSGWNMKNIWLLLKKIVSKTGFFLFFLIMYGVLIRFGMFINSFIGPYLRLPVSPLVVNISFWGILGFFKPEGDWMDLIELTIALGFMVYSGWKLSRRKTISIDRNTTEFFIGRDKVAALKTREIHFPLFIKEPEPMLLILDNNRGIEIEELQTEYEFKALKAEIEKGIEKFKAQDFTES